jgi:hypothetical protein
MSRRPQGIGDREWNESLLESIDDSLKSIRDHLRDLVDVMSGDPLAAAKRTVKEAKEKAKPRGKAKVPNRNEDEWVE